MKQTACRGWGSVSLWHGVAIHPLLSRLARKTPTFRGFPEPAPMAWGRIWLPLPWRCRWHPARAHRRTSPPISQTRGPPPCGCRFNRRTRRHAVGRTRRDPQWNQRLDPQSNREPRLCNGEPWRDAPEPEHGALLALVNADRVRWRCRCTSAVRAWRPGVFGAVAAPVAASPFLGTVRTVPMVGRAGRGRPLPVPKPGPPTPHGLPPPRLAA